VSVASIGSESPDIMTPRRAERTRLSTAIVASKEHLPPSDRAIVRESGLGKERQTGRLTHPSATWSVGYLRPSSWTIPEPVFAARAGSAPRVNLVPSVGGLHRLFSSPPDRRVLRKLVPMPISGRPT